jgi:hypothetical protein
MQFLETERTVQWNIYKHEENKVTFEGPIVYITGKGLHTSLDKMRSMLKSSAGLTAESFIDKNCTICTYRVRKWTSQQTAKAANEYRKRHTSTCRCND